MTDTPESDDFFGNVYLCRNDPMEEAQLFSEELERSRNEWKQRYEDLFNESKQKEMWHGRQQTG